jgi:Big-like domain-containing protein
MNARGALIALGSAACCTLMAGTAMASPASGSYGSAGVSTDSHVRSQLPTSTALTVSAARVVFGHEQTERLTVTVAGPAGVAGDIPTGQVTITVGSVVVTTVDLVGGKATVTLTASQLRPGSYGLIASYSGDQANYASASDAQHLAVICAPATANG